MTSSQAEDTTSDTVRNKIHPFDVSNCDIRTQLMWEPWATIPAFKIVTLLLARKGKSIFSSQGISEMLGLPKSTVIHALKLLRENQYILKDGGSYYLNIGRVSDQPIGQSTNPLVRSTNPLVNVDQPIGQNLTNPLVTNNDKEIIIKNDDKVNEGTPPQKPTIFEKAAQEVLVPDDDPEIQSDNRFITAGRKPLKNYPLIWLSKTELMDILKLYEESGIPIDKHGVYKQAFRAVQARLLTNKTEGLSTKKVSSFNWLIGWALNELLDSRKKVADFERSNKYLQNARAR